MLIQILKSLAGLVSELWPSLLNWWRVAVLFVGECGRKGGSSPSAPSVSLVGSIESFTLEPDLQLQAKSDRIVLGVLWTLPSPSGKLETCII